MRLSQQCDRRRGWLQTWANQQLVVTTANCWLVQ